MKIFSSEQIHKWDQFTISNEPIESIQLMERAASKCAEQILSIYSGEEIVIFCGPGNNGGDGLAIARILWEQRGLLSKVILFTKGKGSADYNTNLKRWLAISGVEYYDPENKPDLTAKIIIDALFGNGINKPLSGAYQKAVEQINNSGSYVVSIDLPSGMYVDKSSIGNTIIKANETLTFQTMKLGLLMPENEVYFGLVTLIDIGLLPEFEKEELSGCYLTQLYDARELYRPGGRFAHKGNFGHAALITGSYGMMGASVLSARGCLKSGVGKLTCIIPEEGYIIMQTSVPEAMCRVSGKYTLSGDIDVEKYDVVGIGPGIGNLDEYKELLKKVFLQQKRPVVIDADALNVISQHLELLKLIPANSILTPHPGEFDRLFGKTKNNFDQRRLAVQKAKELQIFIVLKGRYTFIATPEGTGHFNSSGNSGMATGGSGDVLTGMLTALLARGYPPKDAAIFGVYLHGMAGDIAAHMYSEESMTAGDIPDFIGSAIHRIANYS
ncbi:MAG: NAD(P)H-hydrate dehydratase [Chitinophagaceae bacterium]|nr:NAD(P)H-hydrate dehydratase [Chitinophagaceae bacterium]